jgi:hypothetical protein
VTFHEPATTSIVDDDATRFTRRHSAPDALEEPNPNPDPFHVLGVNERLKRLADDVRTLKHQERALSRDLQALTKLVQDGGEVGQYLTVCCLLLVGQPIS